MIFVEAMNQKTTGILSVMNALLDFVSKGLLPLDYFNDLLFDLFSEFEDLLHSETGLAHFLLGSSFGKVANMRKCSLLDSHDLAYCPNALRCNERFFVIILRLSLVFSG